MVMTMAETHRGERVILIDKMSLEWENALKYLSEGGDLTVASLQLARSDLINASTSLDCEYCRRHVLEEVKLIERTLDLAKLSNAYLHAHGLGEKISVALSAVKITWLILLGGLRRAGLI